MPTIKNIVSVFLKNKILLLLLVLLIVYIGYRLVILNKQTPTPTSVSPIPSSPKTQVFTSFVENAKTKTEIEEVLGEPKKEDGGVSYYSSTSPNRDHSVIYEEDKAVFAKEVVTAKDNKNMKDLRSVFGEPKNVLYSNDPEDIQGFDLLVYPENGIAAYANSFDGTIIELWYFPPSSIEEFHGTWGQDFSFDRQESTEGIY